METAKPEIKVIIAEDHPLYADMVRQVLATIPGFEVIEIVDNGMRLMQVLNRVSPQLILLDINMPFRDGLETATLVKKNLPGVRIVFVSAHHTSAIVAQARNCGADGFLPKSVAAPELKAALLRIVSGEEVFLMPEKNNRPGGAANEDSFARKYRLSPREMQIVNLIRKGDATKEIADVLGVSKHTVEAHRKNIYKKLGVQKSTEMIELLNSQE